MLFSLNSSPIDELGDKYHEAAMLERAFQHNRGGDHGNQPQSTTHSPPPDTSHTEGGWEHRSAKTSTTVKQDQPSVGSAIIRKQQPRGTRSP